MGVVLEIYTCKKKDLYGATLDGHGYDWDIVVNTPKINYFKLKGGYKLASVIFRVITGGGDHDECTLAETVTKDQLRAVYDKLPSVEMHTLEFEEINELKKSIVNILENVNEETDVILFDFA